MKSLTSNRITIDGSQGEGGGQVLRSALTLSLMTGRALSITAIRANRKRPGLLRQHLTAVCAAQEISSARVEGAELGASSLTFVPGTVQAGCYRFAIGSAGSTLLVLQTILLPLCLARGSSEITLEGGTHNPLAPTYEFLRDVYLPVLRRMGVRVEVSLLRPGYAPAGGGAISVKIDPCDRLVPLDLLQRGELLQRRAVAVVNRLPEAIAQKELSVVCDQLKLETDEQELQSTLEADGFGNVLSVSLSFEHITELFSAVGELGKSAQMVARLVGSAAQRYLKAGVPVGDHLADQLLLPFVIAGGGSFRCTALTSHFKTNVSVIEQFLPVSVRVEREERLAWRVTIEK